MIGTRIGRYELLRPLASGGMGEVYLAHHDASDAGFGSLVAVKVLLSHLGSNAGFVRMFLDEARAVAKLRHEHIVQIRDIAHHRGQYYMVMEYIRGQTLRELIGNTSIKDRPLFSPRLGAQLFADLAGALAVVHREGLIHRDLSPNNIMISDAGIPKLIDFGVVRAIGTASLTNPGTLKGKFGYMAPEYVRSQSYDHRVDLFSLGVVMWETFTRRRLFPGTSAVEQLQKMLDAEIPRLDEVVPDFPQPLADLVACALQRDPERRIRTAATLADQLAQLARSQPLDTTTPTLRSWLEQRISLQIAERAVDKLQGINGELSAEARAEIPLGLSGSPPDDADLEISDVQDRTHSLPSAHSGASIRLANGEVVSAAARDLPGAPKRATVAIAAAVALALVAVVAVTSRGSERMHTPAPAAVLQPAPSRPAPSVADLHRQHGLDAMASHDYAKAISEFAEAMRGGAANDLVQLMELARRLQHGVSERLPRPVRSPMASAELIPERSTPITNRRIVREPEATRTEVAPTPSSTLVLQPRDEPALDAVDREHAPATSPPSASVAPALSPAARPVTPPPRAHIMLATPRVTMDGDVGAGERVVSACNACHASAGVAAIAGRQQSRAQWERFFATGKHDRYVAIGDQLSANELGAARAFLRAHAYDAPEDQGAGIREP